MSLLEQSNDLEVMQELEELQIQPETQDEKVTVDKKKKGPEKKPAKTKELTRINTRKEWKLLYMPYPFKGDQLHLNSQKAETDATLRDKGLCANCKKRDMCTYPKQESHAEIPKPR